MQATTVGIDLAKNVFQLALFDEQRRLIEQKRLRRAKLLGFFAQQPQATVVMEACASAHYWARQIQALGHEVVLVPAQHVRALVLGNKNDANDAVAIVETSWRPTIRSVPIKSVQQQDLQSLQRFREQVVRERTALVNNLRGLLAEYGVVTTPGLAALRRLIAEVLDPSNEQLSPLMQQLVCDRYQHWQQIDRHLDELTKRLLQEANRDAACQRLNTIPGFGPVVAAAFVSAIGNGASYQRGRDVSASLGLVPKQHSSGDHSRLFGISKRGDKRLRSLLIHGARSVVSRAAGKTDRLSRWIQNLEATRGRNKAVVALANKLARIGWAVLRHQTVYQATQVAA